MILPCFNPAFLSNIFKDILDLIPFDIHIYISRGILKQYIQCLCGFSIVDFFRIFVKGFLDINSGLFKERFSRTSLIFKKRFSKIL